MHDDEIKALKFQVSELQKKLSQIKEAVCLECSGSGEIGLADGEVPCPVCSGSGDPTKPGVFRTEKRYHEHPLCAACFRQHEGQCEG
jgi:RecJ-like exonuclease